MMRPCSDKRLFELCSHLHTDMQKIRISLKFVTVKLARIINYSSLFAGRVWRTLLEADLKCQRVSARKLCDYLVNMPIDQLIGLYERFMVKRGLITGISCNQLQNINWKANLNYLRPTSIVIFGRSFRVGNFNSSKPQSNLFYSRTSGPIGKSLRFKSLSRSTRKRADCNKDWTQ